MTEKRKLDVVIDQYLSHGTVELISTAPTRAVGDILNTTLCFSRNLIYLFLDTKKESLQNCIKSSGSDK